MQAFRFISLHQNKIQQVNPLQIVRATFFPLKEDILSDPYDYGKRDVLGEKDTSIMRLEMVGGATIKVEGEEATKLYSTLEDMNLLSDELRKQIRDLL